MEKLLEFEAKVIFKKSHLCVPFCVPFCVYMYCVGVNYSLENSFVDYKKHVIVLAAWKLGLFTENELKWIDWWVPRGANKLRKLKPASNKKK